jgi:hypothetical protein
MRWALDSRDLEDNAHLSVDRGDKRCTIRRLILQRCNAKSGSNRFESVLFA